MAKKSSIEYKVTEFFRTADEASVKAVKGIVDGIVKGRFPKVKAAKRAAAGAPLLGDAAAV